MKKRMLSLALTLVMCLGLAVPALAAGSDFTIENGILTKYNGPGGDVVIPDGVTGIGGQAFAYCTGLTSVVIPDSVTSVGAFAFLDCTGLTGVTIPNSITEFRYGIFQGCTSLTSVTIPSSLKKLDYQTFKGCTSLSSVTIPDSVTSIESHTFESCTALADIYYSGTKEQWEKISIAIWDSDMLKPVTIHYGVKGSLTAMPSNDTLKVNGVIQNATIYKINDSNYFKIRDLAAVLNGTSKQFAVGYDNATGSVTATTGQPYEPTGTELAGAASGSKPAEASNDAIYVNGQKVEAEVYKIDGSNYFKLRDLGAALGFDVGWNQAEGMYINTEG